MTVQIREYQDQEWTVLVQLFEDFQQLLIDLDPIGRLEKTHGHGEAILTKTLAELRKSRGTFLIAVDNERVVGFVVAAVLSPIDEVGVIPARRGAVTDL